MPQLIKLAACQLPEISQEPATALAWIEQFSHQAELQNVSLVCFPECFLQGYLTDLSLAQRLAINLNSSTFTAILTQLASIKPTLVFGLIETDNGLLFNTAVVVSQGQLLGSHRKTRLLPGEAIFTPGSTYQVFETQKLKFGICICYETQFAETTAQLASAGAQLIVCPSNNLMSRQKAEKYKLLHHQTRIKRAQETGLHIISADITGQTNGRIGYGPTSIITPLGQIASQVPLLQVGMTIDQVSI